MEMALIAGLRNYVRQRHARRAAIVALAPLIADSLERQPVPPASIWYEPYLIGLLASLITIVARRAEPELDEEALGAVQMDAWGRLTGMNERHFAREMCSLCLDHDLAFLQGCDDALALARLPLVEASVPRFDLDPGITPSAEPASPTWLDGWRHYFEMRAPQV